MSYMNQNLNIVDLNIEKLQNFWKFFLIHCLHHFITRNRHFICIVFGIPFDIHFNFTTDCSMKRINNKKQEFRKIVLCPPSKNIFFFKLKSSLTASITIFELAISSIVLVNNILLFLSRRPELLEFTYNFLDICFKGNVSWWKEAGCKVAGRKSHT